MDHGQVRGWRCVHRHFFVTQLSHLFCARVRQEYDDSAGEESDRLSAITSELSRLGGEVSIDRGTLLIRPGSMSSATIDPHGDHRIAMAAALVGLQVPGVKVAHPEVVNKTWPGYWQMLAGLSTG